LKLRGLTLPRPFTQTFNWLYSRLPFSDTTRTVLRVWAEAIRQELLDLQTEADEVYDAIFITEADGTDLDAWGEVLDVERGVMADPAYRAALLAEWQATFAALTVTAVTDAVDALGATYVPVLSVDDVAEHYKDRLEDGTGAANDYDLGDRWGLARLDLSTFAVEIDRIPTAAEAEDLIQAIGEVRPAQTRGFLVVPLPAPPGTPPRYRLYGTSYSDDVAPWFWDDNFERPVGWGTMPSYYQLVNDGGAGTSWEITLDGAVRVLYGDASDTIAGRPGLCFPRQDLTPAILDYRDMYMDCSVKFKNITVVEHSGIALRYDDATGVFYAIAFHWTGATWQYQFMRWTGAAWVVIVAWTNTAADLTFYTHIQTWLEDNEWTLIINDVVEENKTDIGNDITTDGEWGFYIYGTGDFDIWIDWWRMW
jgi:hypothetical protein